MVEVLIVVVMIGLLAGLGWPVISGTRDRLAVDRSVIETLTFFNTARLAAVLHGSRVRIEFGSDRLVGAFEGSTDSTFLVATGPRAYGVTMTSSRDVIRIQSTGLGWGLANTKLVFRRGRAADSLTTSRLGRIRRFR